MKMMARLMHAAVAVVTKLAFLYRISSSLRYNAANTDILYTMTPMTAPMAIATWNYFIKWMFVGILGSIDY